MSFRATHFVLLASLAGKALADDRLPTTQLETPFFTNANETIQQYDWIVDEDTVSIQLDRSSDPDWTYFVNGKIVGRGNLEFYSNMGIIDLNNDGYPDIWQSYLRSNIAATEQLFQYDPDINQLVDLGYARRGNWTLGENPLLLLWDGHAQLLSFDNQDGYCAENLTILVSQVGGDKSDCVFATITHTGFSSEQYEAYPITERRLQKCESEHERLFTTTLPDWFDPKTIEPYCSAGN